jgi:hypothetical protein
LASRLIGFGDGPGEAASAKAKGIDLKLKFAQSLVIELQLHLSEPEFGAQGIISAVEAHVFGNDSLVPSHTQSGELKIDSAFMEPREEMPFYNARETDLININQTSENQQNEKPDCDSGITETNPTSAPEASSITRFRHGAAYWTLR